MTGEGADEQAIEAELRRIRTETIGVGGEWPADREAAAIIVEWYSQAAPR